jgi:hypothetical protein
VVIAGYFAVASLGEQLVFFGEQLTEEQRRRADLLMTMAVLVLFVGTPVAVFVAAPACGTWSGAGRRTREHARA